MNQLQDKMCSVSFDNANQFINLNSKNKFLIFSLSSRILQAHISHTPFLAFFKLKLGYHPAYKYKLEKRVKEIRIDVSHQAKEELELAARHAQLVFKFNHTMPETAEYNLLMKEIFHDMGARSNVHAPLTVIRPHMVHIGKNVIVMNGCLMMGAGGIFIEDNAMLAANVQLLSNNHDLYQREVIICKPVHIKTGAWIGAGATILPGVTIGENAVVGAASVVTHDVDADTIVAGNPAKFIRKI